MSLWAPVRARKLELTFTELTTQVLAPSGEKHTVYAVSVPRFNADGEIGRYYVQLRTKAQCDEAREFKDDQALIQSENRLGFMILSVNGGQQLYEPKHLLIKQLFNTSDNGLSYEYISKEVYAKLYKGVGRALAEEFTFRLSVQLGFEGHVLVESAWAGVIAHSAYGFVYLGDRGTARAEEFMALGKGAKAKNSFYTKDCGGMYLVLPPAARAEKMEKFGLLLPQAKP